MSEKNFALPSAQYYAGGGLPKEIICEAIRNGELLCPDDAELAVEEIISHVDLVSVGLTASDVFMRAHEPSGGVATLSDKPSYARVAANHRGVVTLNEGESVFCQTRERICLPQNVFGIISTECGYPSSFMIVRAVSVLAPGFNSVLLVEVCNVGLDYVQVKPGDKLATITFVTCIK